MSELFEILHTPDASDPLLYWYDGNGELKDYVENNPGTIVIYKHNDGFNVICKILNNIECGKVIDDIMKGLRDKKIMSSNVVVFPVNYYVADYIDANHKSGYICAFAKSTR